MIETPFNYTGSKFKLLKQILPKMDYTKSNFVDIFCGGGSVYTNILDKYDKVIVNDIIGDLIGIHKSLMDGDDIIDRAKSLCPGKDNPIGFGELRDEYNRINTPEGLWALMLSSTNNMMRFNKKFKYNQTYGQRGWNNNTDKKVEGFTSHIRQYKDKVKYNSLRFNDININGGDYMVYLDPPYGRIKNEDGSIGKKQISEAGYNAFWDELDDIRLYEYIKSIDGNGSSFMVSGVLSHDGKTCWMLDKLINDGYNSIELTYDYNKVSRKGDKKTTEVIITNYEI